MEGHLDFGVARESALISIEQNKKHDRILTRQKRGGLVFKVEE